MTRERIWREIKHLQKHVHENIELQEKRRLESKTESTCSICYQVHSGGPALDCSWARLSGSRSLWQRV